MRPNSINPQSGLRGRGFSRRWLLLLLATVLVSCTKEYSVKDLVNSRQPTWAIPRPAGLSAVVGNQEVQLAWTLDDPAHQDQILRYRAYRRSGNESATLTDSSLSSPLTLHGLNNGVGYFLSLSAVLKNGLEGTRSDEILAVPGVFGLQIEDGRNLVNSLQVRLTLTAPQGVSGMRVSNSPDVADAPVQSYAASLIWQLLPPDGEKTVYVQFLDGQGNPSVSDSDRVTLDTAAQIRSITVTPPDTTVYPGQILHFEMATGEQNGKAAAELGAGGRKVELLDDGTSGDRTANDGTYSLDYRVEEDLSLIDGVVTGSFTDEAGNVASPLAAAGRLTVRRQLDPVVLSHPTVTETSILLSFSQCQSASFSAYRIYRGEKRDLQNDPHRRLLSTVTRASQTTYEDNDALEENRPYWYRVDVVDNLGFSAASLPDSARIADQPPHAVTLNQPSSVGKTSVLLTWSQNQDLDFRRYEIYRSLVPGISRANLLIAHVDTVQVTSRTDQGLIENTSYYYRIFVVDKAGHATGSAEEPKVTTLNADPPAVTITTCQPGALAPATSVDLGWTISTAHDFKEYRIYRGTTPAVGTSDDLVRTIPDSSVVSHLDDGLTDNTRYYYRIFVNDTQGGSAGSAASMVVTRNLAPQAVTLTATPDTSSASIKLSWSANSDHDFRRYSVWKGTNAGVFPDTLQLTRLGAYYQKNQTQTAFYTFPSDTTRYFFMVAVADLGIAPNTSLTSTSNVAGARLKKP